ncbi:NAD(P)-dependent oxidoreductase [Orbus wheelerorum]|uniref:NAD-dependent epimerase/dehydratase family protein n=1 Tax=Orbus wheelerorum TaxID=3074111 RepID=UPI00370CFF7F
MKKVLVTGYSGFIGHSVTNELLNRGYNVVGLYSTHKLPEQKNLTQIRLDLLNKSEVDTFFTNNHFENLIHMAWYLGPKCHIDNINMAWLEMSLCLLQSFYKTGGKKFLCNGTISEYDFSYGYLSENKTPLNNNSLHGKCKASLYSIASVFCQQNNIDFKWPRIFNLYGPYEKPNRLMPSVINSMLIGNDVRVSDCLKIQDYLHVFDVARGIVDIFESKVNGAVNVCSNNPIKLRKIVETIADITNFKGDILWGAIPSSFDDPFVVGSNKILTENIGWSQNISLEEGLSMASEWWRKFNV